MSTRPLAATLLLLLASAPAARAEMLLVGSNPATTEVTFPFDTGSDGPADPSTNYQQVYSASLFHGPVRITALTFYATPGLGGGGPINPVTYEVSLSTTSQTVSGLSSNFNGNLGADNALFATFTPGALESSPSFTISGAQGFLYTPGQGNLLLDIRIPNQDGASFTASLDGFGSEYGLSNSVNNFGDPSAGGLVTGITYFAVPEPSGWLMFGLGSLAVARAARRRAA